MRVVRERENEHDEVEGVRMLLRRMDIRRCTAAQYIIIILPIPIPNKSTKTRTCLLIYIFLAFPKQSSTSTNFFAIKMPKDEKTMPKR